MATPLPKNVTRIEKPSASVVAVTPDMAQKWIAKNTVNRNLRQSRIQEYARDMANGNWEITGEAVKFANNGRLLDGQHRLHAIVVANVTVTMFVVRGLEPEAQDVMDSGAARTSADALGFQGVKNAATLAAAARVMLRRDYGGETWNYRPTRTEIAQWIEQNPDIEIAGEIGMRYYKYTDTTPTVITVSSYLIGNSAGYDAAETGWNAAATKVGLRAGDPVIALTNAFAEHRRKQRHLDPRASLSAVIRAFNARANGKTLMSVKFTSMSKDGTVNRYVPIPKVTA